MASSTLQTGSGDSVKDQRDYNACMLIQRELVHSNIAHCMIESTKRAEWLYSNQLSFIVIIDTVSCVPD